MRTPLRVAVIRLAVLGALGGLLIAPTHFGIAPGGAPSPIAGLEGDAHRAPSYPSAVPWMAGWNATTISPTPAAAPPPNSAVTPEPPPTPPGTTPIILSVFTAYSSKTPCCFSQNLTPPTGTWALIVLNYTGTVVSTVYDSSYRVYLDKSLVLLGTSPEYGSWNVLKDVTEYSSLFRGVFNLTFIPPNAVPMGSTGYFLNSLSIAFYPVPTGGHAPMAPNLILPLWFFQVLRPTTPVMYNDFSIPSNVTSASIQLYPYGFGFDEFWYTTEPSYSPARVIQISVNGTPLASILPFSYINTGGIDLYAWRPLTGSFTTSDRPDTVDITAALGLLEGSRNLTARLTGIPPSSDWIASGSLFLYTSANAGNATLSSYSYSAPIPTIATDSTTYYNLAGRVNYAYSSIVNLPGAATNVSSATSQTYVNDATLNRPWLGANWTNITSDEHTNTLTTFTNSTATVSERHTVDFPVRMDIGKVFVQSKSTNGSYPIYGNLTQYLDSLVQQWNESTVLSGGPASGVHNVMASERTTGLLNIYTAYEELTGPTSGLVISTSLINSQTTKEFVGAETSGVGAWSYSHLLVGSAYQPSGPYFAETILVNEVNSPLSEVVGVSQPIVDLGSAVTFAAHISGGTPPLTVTWTGLPAGCAAANTSMFTCTPTATGTYLVTALVTDSAGNIAAPGSTSLAVNPLLTVALYGTSRLLDVGTAGVVNATVAGGTPPYRCLWSLNGMPPVATAGCPLTDPFTPTSPTPITFKVEVTDSVGKSVNSTGYTVIVDSPPAVTIAPLASSSFTVDTPVTLSAVVTAGSGGLSFEWVLNGTPVFGVNGSSFVFVPLGAGNYTYAVTVRDVGGGAATSAALVVPVTPKSAPPSSGGGSGSASSNTNPGGLEWPAFLVLGIVGGVIVGLLLARLLPPRPSGGADRPRPVVRRRPVPEEPPPEE